MTSFSVQDFPSLLPRRTRAICLGLIPPLLACIALPVLRPSSWRAPLLLSTAFWILIWLGLASFLFSEPLEIRVERAGFIDLVSPFRVVRLATRHVRSIRPWTDLEAPTSAVIMHTRGRIVLSNVGGQFNEFIAFIRAHYPTIDTVGW